MANVYFFFLPVNSAAHNTLTSSCDCFIWLVSSGEEKQNVCIGVLKQSMFLLQQNCTTFFSSNTRAGFHLLRPNGRSDTGEWRRLQCCTFPSDSGHRPIKIPNVLLLSPHPDRMSDYIIAQADLCPIISPKIPDMLARCPLTSCWLVLP